MEDVILRELGNGTPKMRGEVESKGEFIWP